MGGGGDSRLNLTTLTPNQESDAFLTEAPRHPNLTSLMFSFISGETDAGMAKRNAQDLRASHLLRWEWELHARGLTHKFLEGKDEFFPQVVLKCLFWSRCYGSEGDVAAVWESLSL